MSIGSNSSGHFFDTTLNANGTLYATSAGVIASAANGTTGQVWTATTSSPPGWANAAASSISITGDSGGAQSGNAFTFTASGIGLSFAGATDTFTLGGTLKLANGGTNANLTASNGGIFYSTASAGAILAGTATANQLLMSGSSTTPAWSTSTYPATNAVNTLLYASSANTMAALATADNGVLITSASGVPSWLADGTTGQVLTATTGSPPSWSTITTGVSSVTGTANQILASPTTGAVVVSLIGPYTPATYTAHGILVGEGTSSIVAISPDATSGISLISKGSSTDPAYGTAVVAGGGTGDTSFTAYSVICGGTTTTGALQNVSGVGTSGQVLTSNGASALPTWQSAASSGITTIDGDTGSATGSTVTFSGANAGTTVKFSATGSTVSLSVSDGFANTFMGNSAGGASASGSNNVGIGPNCFNSITSGLSNSGLGNVTLNSLTTGSYNTALGAGTLSSIVGGGYNIAVGYSAGENYSGSEGSNIVIGNTGTAAESNVIRIGTQGSSPGQQNKCFIAGIEGVSVSSLNMVTINTSTGQLGSQAYSAFASINVQTFTSGGTYTPTSGMLYCIIECVSGGGAGGGTAAAAAASLSVGGGGGGGAYSRKFATAATVGASQTVTVGAGGTPGATGNHAGGNGGSSSVGSICTANGGTGGGGNAGSTSASGGAGGTAGTGDFSVPGQAGASTYVVANVSPQGAGGSSCLGFGAFGVNNQSTGAAGSVYGGGGSGGQSYNAGAATAGGAGAAGIVIITEYI